MSLGLALGDRQHHAQVFQRLLGLCVLASLGFAQGCDPPLGVRLDDPLVVTARLALRDRYARQTIRLTRRVRVRTELAILPSPTAQCPTPCLRCKPNQ
ncbi:hypothetical protein SAMN05428943_1061 [Streptomyces sp. 2314.4]|nr:hypothetical protein SAMN05428943_1061 [Streptomyces sp. 2314.4]